MPHGQEADVTSLIPLPGRHGRLSGAISAECLLRNTGPEGVEGGSDVVRAAGLYRPWQPTEGYGSRTSGAVIPAGTNSSGSGSP